MAGPFTSADLTQDAFLGGQLRLFQPRTGYRAGIDPVVLAACIPARAGQSVLELGCGAGAAILCLGRRVAGLRLTGVERQAAYAELARTNAAENDIALEVVTGDLSSLPVGLRQRQFDHVMANPPYFLAQSRQQASDPGREAALAEDTPLAQWVDVAARRLAPGGYLHMIQRVERLPALLTACEGRIGSLELLPLQARAGRGAHLIVLRGRKTGRAMFRMHAAVVMHQGLQHDRDGESYRPEIDQILRHGAPLNWPDTRKTGGN